MSSKVNNAQIQVNSPDDVRNVVLIGNAAGLGPIYYFGLTLAATLALHHLWLIRDRDRMRCFAAFRGNNLFGMAVFVGVALDYAVRTGAWPRWYA